MIKIIDQNFDRRLWDQKAIHPLQSWEWGEAREKMGIKVIRIGEFDREKLMHVFQLTLHQLPYIQSYIGYLPRSIFPSKKVLEYLERLGKEENCVFIKIEPYEEKLKIANQKSKIKISPHPLFPQWTQILDLKPTAEELLKNMKPKTRYNIRLAEKKGVIIKEVTNQKGFEVFAKLYFETCKRQRYHGHDRHYHQIIFDQLKINIAHILIAYYQDVPLAAYELFYFNSRMYYVYGGTSLEYRNLMGANLLMWEAIKLGKKLGADRFDMWGSLAPNYNQKHDWAGFTRFKEGYGTEFVNFVPGMDLIIDPIKYQIYNLAFRIRNIFI